ncbi:MAG: DUF1385 domain-containing protein [Actinomycetota bacterium]|nr:DUF1385 domain-containing protein [Actinomycetota bacterium]
MEKHQASNDLKGIGGQAVIEGVMFKSKKGWSVAVRDPAGVIHLKTEPLKPHRLEKTPLFRGFFILFYTLLLGIKALEFSAQISGGKKEGDGEKPISPIMMAGTLLVSVGAALVLFLFVPLLIAKLVGFLIAPVAASSLLFNVADGISRAAIFLLYVWVIGLWKETGRIFEYHGAEHKVIHAFEDGGLDMENIIKASPRHPRCGTSFLLIVMALSIIVFSFIPQHWPLYFKFLSRLVLIPLVAGLSYEVLKLSAKFEKNPFMRLMVLPGLALQKLTTREPDQSQIEVSLKALEGVMTLEES